MNLERIKEIEEKIGCDLDVFFDLYGDGVLFDIEDNIVREVCDIRYDLDSKCWCVFTKGYLFRLCDYEGTWRLVKKGDDR